MVRWRYSIVIWRLLIVCKRIHKLLTILRGIWICTKSKKINGWKVTLITCTNPLERHRIFLHALQMHQSNCGNGHKINSKSLVWSKKHIKNQSEWLIGNWTFSRKRRKYSPHVHKITQWKYGQWRYLRISANSRWREARWWRDQYIKPSIISLVI